MGKIDEISRILICCIIIDQTDSVVNIIPGATGDLLGARKYRT